MRCCMVFQAQCDAEVDITKAAVNAVQKHSTILIGKDTDLLILLRYYAEANRNRLYFRLDNQSRDFPKVYYMDNLKSILDSELCAQLLFLHAFTGGDSISHIYDVVKKLVFRKKLKCCRVLYQIRIPLI